MGLEPGVFEERGSGFNGFRKAEFTGGYNLDAIGTQQGGNLLRLAAIVRRQTQLLPAQAAHRLPQRRLLSGHKRGYSAFGQIEQIVHLGAAEGASLGRHLHFDQPGSSGHDEVSICAGLGILRIIQVKNGLTGIDSAGHGGNMIKQRVGQKCAGRAEATHSQSQRHETAGNGRAARSTVGFDHVAINNDLTLTKGQLVHPGTQGSADQSLNLLCPPTLLAGHGFAPVAAGRGAGQHAVLCGHPALSGSLEEWWGPVLDRGRTEYACSAHRDQAGPFGMAHHARFDGDAAHLVQFPP